MTAEREQEIQQHRFNFAAYGLEWAKADYDDLLEEIDRQRERIEELEGFLAASESLRQQYIDQAAKAGIIHTKTIDAIRTLREALLKSRAWMFLNEDENTRRQEQYYLDLKITAAALEATKEFE